MIPFLDLKAAHDELREAIDEAIGRVVDRGQFVLGEEVAAFESEFAAYVGAEHCVGVGNGLDALELILRAVGIGPGDEVIVPANTFIATWLAVSRIGATVVPVEPHDDTFNIDPAAVEAALTPGTRAVIVVHLYGQPADVPALRSVLAGRDIVLIEDAAQAHGATIRGVPVGGLGDAAAWSFYPGKNLGAIGDAGAVTTNDPSIAHAVAKLRNYGSSRKYVHEAKGFNSRLDEIQAAVLRVKLPKLSAWNARRAAVADLYGRMLSTAAVRIPFVPDWAQPVWHLYVVRTALRDELASHLAGRGIQSQIHYPTPPRRQGAYVDEAFSELPITERIHREVLSLPMGPHLSLSDAGTVAQAVGEFVGP